MCKHLYKYKYINRTKILDVISGIGKYNLEDRYLKKKKKTFPCDGRRKHISDFFYRVRF